jgi:hypothetical protein
MMYCLVVYFIAATFLNLPPSDFVTATYCRLFDTKEYYLVLNMLVLVIPALLVFKLTDRNIRKHSGFSGASRKSTKLRV